MQTQVQSKKKRPLWKKITIGVCTTLVLLVGSSFTYEAIAGYQGVKKYPAPGKMVDVGDFKLHLHKQGEGKPTIILEPGSRSSSTIWGDIPEELMDTATVVSYDRGGYGWSEKTTTERTGENIVNELYTALKKENIEGPYILVGHSIGGMYTRLFAQKYPDEVAGMILLDARHEDYSKDTDPILEKNGIDPVLMGSYSKGMMTFLKVSGVIRLMGEDTFEDVPKEQRNQAMNIEIRPKYFQALEDEIREMPDLEDGIRNQSLGSMPLTVVTHGIPIDGTVVGIPESDNNTMEEIWQEQQKQLLKLSSNSELIVAKESSHSIMIDEPNLVVDVIKNMIDQIN
jgi:pimeloyl-ACP methyl ester carboxylesterase